MSLTICLDDQPPQYSGNETFRGEVTLQCFKPIEIDEIRLTFSGVSEAKVQKVKGSAAPAKSYLSKCVLFEKDWVLAHPDGQFFNTGTYSWPFELQFPSHAESQTKASNWSEMSSFRSDKNHPLPPTFAAKCEDALRKLDCTIAYRIHAQACKPAGFMGKRSPYVSEVLPLQFMPPLGKADVLDAENPERTSSIRKNRSSSFGACFCFKSIEVEPLESKKNFVLSFHRVICLGSALECLSLAQPAWLNQRHSFAFWKLLPSWNILPCPCLQSF